MIPSLPQAGKIVKTGHNDMWDAVEWTLSNGVKVLIKTTKFKEDEILMTAVANEGMSRVLKNIDVASYQTMSLVTESYGINSYTNSDLQKYLQGKQAAVSLGLNSYSRSVGGSTTPKDLAVMMELVYGVFTGFNVSADEFKALQELYVGLIQNQEANPQYVFSRDLSKALYKSPYRQTMSVDDVKNADREVIINTVRGQLDNAADYTFVFVGNVDPETLKPLVEQYIATLPANASAATKMVAKADPALGITPGNGRDEFTTKMENPQTWVAIIESATMPYNIKDINPGQHRRPDPDRTPYRDRAREGGRRVFNRGFRIHHQSRGNERRHAVGIPDEARTEGEGARHDQGSVRRHDTQHQRHRAQQGQGVHGQDLYRKP